MHVARRLALCALFAACTPDGKPPIFTNVVRGEIGGACDADGDCHSGACQTTSFAGNNVGAPGGYCTHECSGDSDCTPGKCISFGSRSFCVARCEKPSHCRDDYVCNAAEGFCEPAAMVRLECDPSVADCTTAAGQPGGCLRSALGSGTFGACVRACSLDGSLGCDPGQGCHLFDTHVVGGAFANDAFRGMMCFKETANPPTVIAGSCQSFTECVSTADCAGLKLADGSTLQVCVQNCSIGSTCDDGKPCTSYVTPTPGIGYCPIF